MLFWRTIRKKAQHHVSNSSIWRNLSSKSSSVVEMAGKDGELRVFIVAGEVSGDIIASRLMSSLKKLSPFPIRFSGVGGFMMSNQGLSSLFSMEEISIMGIWELLPHLNKFRVKLKDTIEAALLFKPHVVVTVDSKGFSFRLLRQLRAKYSQRQGEAVDSPCPLHFHYVAPSFWAWKGGEERLKGLSKFVDHILCILPFEEEVCNLNGIPATFVGHPVIEDVFECNLGDIPPTEWRVQGSSENFRNKFNISSDATIISLLPGSRLQEVTRMLPIFSKTMEKLKPSYPKLMTVIHAAPNRHVENYLHKVLQDWPVPVTLLPGASPHLKYNAFNASKVALCTSGTVALELQLARLPCVVAYRAHFLTEWVIRYKAKIAFISLPNILLNSSIIPEALFQACTATKLTLMLGELINNDGLQEEQSVAAEKVMRMLWPSDKYMGNSMKLNLDSTYSDHTPSMASATTILYFVKP